MRTIPVLLLGILTADVATNRLATAGTVYTSNGEGLVTNTAGAQVSRHDFLPFGEESTATSGGDVALKFTGHERDQPGKPIDYMHARFCSPVLARFMRVDPAGGSARTSAPQTWNRYSYVGNNPIKYVDPDGLIIRVAAKAPGFIRSALNAAAQRPDGRQWPMTKLTFPAPANRAPAKLLITFFCLFNLQCGANSSLLPRRSGAPTPCSAGMLTIEVSGEDGPRLPDAHVVAHAGSSRRIETSTNSVGEVCIDKNLILDPAVTSISFCKAGYSCGVMLLSDIREYLPRIEYQLILLAPHAARPGTISGSEASGLGAGARRCPESTSFEVVVQNSEGSGIPATEIRLLYEQETLVGLTNSQGIFCLSRESVQGDYGLLVACHRAFFCGAVSLQGIAPPEPVELRLAKGAVP